MGKPSPIQLWKAEATDSPLYNFSILELKLFASSTLASFPISNDVSAGIAAASAELQKVRRLMGCKEEMQNVRRSAANTLCS